MSFPNQNPLALCNSEDGQPKPKPCNLSFDYFRSSHDESGLTISGDANQASIVQSTLPSLLEESTFVVSFSNQNLTCKVTYKESQECQVVGGKAFHSQFQSS